MFENKNQKSEIIKWGIAAGFLECFYVFLVILVFNILGDRGQQMENFITGGLFMLLFFVLSVLISGVLVLGRPIILVLNRKITEAISVFFVTLATIFIIFTVVFATIIL